MKRQRDGVVYNIQDEPIVLSHSLVKSLLNEPNASDLITLYIFYYSTAKWQNTNQPKCTAAFVAKGLGWCINRVRRIKKQLRDLEMIEDVQQRDPVTYQIQAHYIRVHFIWNKSTHRVKKQPIILSKKQQNPTKNKPSLKQRNEKYIGLARHLYNTIHTVKNITWPDGVIEQRWTNEFRSLHEQNGVDIDRIKRALCWYKKYVGGEYIPVIESGSSFRQKFFRLEAAMKRNGGNEKADNTTGFDVVCDYFSKQKKPRKYIEDFYRQHFNYIYSPFRQIEQVAFARGLVHLYEQLEDGICKEQDVMPVQILYDYADWVEENTWLKNITKAMLDVNHTIFKKFKLEKFRK